MLGWESLSMLGVALACLAVGQFCLLRDVADLRGRLFDAEARLADLPPYRELRPYSMSSLESRR